MYFLSLGVRGLCSRIRISPNPYKVGTFLSPFFWKGGGHSARIAMFTKGGGLFSFHFYFSLPEADLDLTVHSVGFLSDLLPT